MFCKQHGLARAGRGHDQRALPLAYRRHQVEHAGGEVFRVGFEPQLLVRVERRQVVEKDPVARHLGRLEVDRLNFDEREVSLAFFGRSYLARDGVARPQVEFAYLRGADVDVVGSRQVVVVRGAQEAEPVGQRLKHAFREDEAALFGLRLQYLEDQLLLSHSGSAGDVQVFCYVGELRDRHLFQLAYVHQLIYFFCHCLLKSSLGWCRLIISGMRNADCSSGVTGFRTSLADWAVPV